MTPELALDEEETLLDPSPTFHFVCDRSQPDERKTDRGDEGWAARTRRWWLSRICEIDWKNGPAHGCSSTGFSVPIRQIQQTWGRAESVADACPEILETIAVHDDYCGIHPHLWRWDGRRSTWFNDLSNVDWTAQCLQTAIEGFQRIFGRRPGACRFGDRYLNDDAVRLMKGAGIRYDLTIEPGLPDEPVPGDPLATRRLPDYRGARREPYRPSPANYLAPDPEAEGTCDLWMIPLTTTVPAWRLVRRPPYLVKASRSRISRWAGLAGHTCPRSWSSRHPFRW